MIRSYTLLELITAISILNIFQCCPIFPILSFFSHFHGGNTGSNPVSPTKQNTLSFKVFFDFRGSLEGQKMGYYQVNLETKI